MSADEQGRQIAMRTAAHKLAINALGLYAMLMYGITYYAVTTAAPHMAKEFGYPASSIFAVITAALLATAALAPRLGRMTDRVGASNVLIGGACLRSALIACMALSPESVTFAITLLLVQILGQATEYDATFAAAVELAGENARGGMSQITLWGGLASTIFWPATAFMLERMHWRSMFLIYAAVVMVICVPIAVFVKTVSANIHGSRAPKVVVSTDAEEMAPIDRPPKSAPPFWLLAAAFALGGVAYTLPTLMLPVLEGLGLGASAVMVGMIFGPAQTAGRFVDMLVGDRIRSITVAAVASAMVAIGFGVLLAGGVWGGIAFALLFGAGAGVGYVVRGSVVLAFYGPQGYAKWLGRLGTVRLVVTALTPLGLATLLEGLGARAVVYVCVAAALLSLACFVVLAMRTGVRKAIATSL